MIERLPEFPDAGPAETPGRQRRASTATPSGPVAESFGQHLASFYPYRVPDPEARTAPAGGNADARQRPLAVQSTAGLSRRRHGRD
jgi:hypothetical protein